MPILRGLATLFLLPGTLVINALDVSVEQDGGILRSFVNMIFWGIVAVVVMLPVMF